MTQDLERRLDSGVGDDPRAGEVMSYDEQLLEKARTQWQFGDWETLASLDPLALRNHPARARLALLSAAACLQLGKLERARSLLRSSRDWGIGQREVLQLLLAGIHNSLGRAAALGGDDKSAAAHFEAAIEIGMPGHDVRLLGTARTREQFSQVRRLVKRAEGGGRTVLIAPKGESKEPQPAFADSPKPKLRKTGPEKKKSKSVHPTPPGLQQMINDLVPFFYGRQLTYVDVGAFIGDVFLSIAHSELRIREAHLVEPNPTSYSRLLRRTTNPKPVRSLHHYQCALGDISGELPLRTAHSMSKVSAETSRSARGAGTVSVPAVTLDRLIQSATDAQIDLLKIDVEGYEESVLRGARETLIRQAADVIIIEVGMNPYGSQQCYYRTVDDILMAFGYRIFRIYEQRNEWLRDSPYLRRANFVYFSSRFASDNPYHLSHELVESKKLIKSLKDQLRRNGASVGQH